MHIERQYNITALELGYLAPILVGHSLAKQTWVSYLTFFCAIVSSSVKEEKQQFIPHMDVKKIKLVNICKVLKTVPGRVYKELLELNSKTINNPI